MLPFAVVIEGLTEQGQALWVLAVDPPGERLLIVRPDKSLHWYPMSECRFAKMLPPDAPRPVIPVQPVGPQGAPLVLPNRAQRRALARKGF